jgi:hypothetical protein
MNAPPIRVFPFLTLFAVLTLFCAPRAQAQAPPAPMPQAAIAPPTRVFGSDTGVVLNFIKPDKTADFEAVVSKVKEALQNSDNAKRKAQASSWKVYKSVETGPGGSALYIFIIDPVVKGADYAVATILGEGFSGDEASGLIKKYTDSYATGQNFVNLALISDFAK